MKKQQDKIFIGMLLLSCILIPSIYLVFTRTDDAFGSSVQTNSSNSYEQEYEETDVPEEPDKNETTQVTDTSDTTDTVDTNEEVQDEEQKNDETTSTEVIEEDFSSEEDEKTEFTWSTVGPEYFDDALFIGDSRTVGLSEYGNLSNATYFALSGMSIYNVEKETVSVANVGRVTLNYLMTNQTYGKIYVMLGINELGYDRNQTVKRFGEFLGRLREAQPNAIIYIGANLHVTESRSSTDAVFNNRNIDAYNAAIAEFADQQSCFYIDVNELFDDANGNLRADYSNDNAHPLGKYYASWCEWLKEHTVN